MLTGFQTTRPRKTIISVQTSGIADQDGPQKIWNVFPFNPFRDKYTQSMVESIHEQERGKMKLTQKCIANNPHIFSPFTITDSNSTL